MHKISNFEADRNLNSFYYILYNKNKFSGMVLPKLRL